MARKSRKNPHNQVVEAANPKEKVYNTALYLRLSILDSGVKGGESIINQQEFLEDYVANRPELNLKGIFVDNGETGTNYDRPAWNDLIRECRSGNINCIVIRDLSRLGRNYIETGELLEKILPLLGVRLISVNDKYDNLHLTLNEQLVANLKNLINDIYAKDISKKVSSAQIAKKKNGEFLGTYAAYGYLKDPLDKHKLIVDPETSPIVVQIFKCKAEGMGTSIIARKLNEMGVSSPNRYRLEKGIVKHEGYANCLWRVSSVKPILMNPVYLGLLAQGKKTAKTCASKQRLSVDKEDWIIVENTHEPIITQELFNQAQLVMEERSTKAKEVRNRNAHIINHEEILRGLVFCPDCKKSIIRVRRFYEGGKKRYYNYICPTHEELKTCPRKHMHEADLNAVVYEALRIEIEKYADIMAVIEKLNRSSNHKSRLVRFDTEIEEAEREIKRISSLKQAVFEDYASKLLTASEYQFAVSKYEADSKRQKQRLEMAKRSKAEFLSNTTAENKWLAVYSRFADFKELTADMAQALIQRIEISEGNKVHITFKFRDEFEYINQYAKQHRRLA